MIVDEEQLERTLDWLRESATAAAKARAERSYLEEWIGSLRAQLAAKAIEAGSSAAAAEIQAKSHPDYQLALKGYREAVELDELFRWRRQAADVVVETWRTQNANARAEKKVLG